MIGQAALSFAANENLKSINPPPAPRSSGHHKRGKCNWATHIEFRFLVGGGVAPERGLRGGGDNWGSLGDLVFCVSCFMLERLISSELL